MFKKLKLRLIITLLIVTSFRRISCKLLMSHIIFSNGETTPASYPGDIYTHHPHFEQFSGHLTQRGELSSYQLGAYLNKRYRSLLDDVYTTNTSQSFASNRPSSQESLQCVHLGLYPSNGKQRFVSFNWQPVPYKVLKGKKDVFFSPLEYCNESTWDLPKDSKCVDIYELLSNHTSTSVTTNEQVYNIYNSIKYQEKYEFAVPDWITDEVSEDMDICSLAFFEQLIQHKINIATGKLLKNIVHTSQQKLANTLVPTNRNMFVYSGETNNVLLMLSALTKIAEVADLRDIIDSHSNALLLELHRLEDGGEGFKLFYLEADKSNDSKRNFQRIIQLDILNCGKFCSVEDFVERIRHLYDPDAACS